MVKIAEVEQMVEPASFSLFRLSSFFFWCFFLVAGLGTFLFLLKIISSSS